MTSDTENYRKVAAVALAATAGMLAGVWPHGSRQPARDDRAAESADAPRLHVLDPQDGPAGRAAASLTTLVELLDDPAPPAPPSTRPAIADLFAPFAGRLTTRSDDRFLYVESDGMPDHPMMVGITNWQQQVPLPQPYVGRNAWPVPRHPVPAERPTFIRGHFLRGAIALAADGVPIFNPQNNRGDVSADIGELDRYGGHCGRADDYHYHVAPLFLEKVLGPGKPIAIALDGYPIYGSTGPDGKPVDERTLDACHGRTDANGDYAYFASVKYPFVLGGFHGRVTERGGQVDPQPRAEPIRPAGRPLRGATITSFASPARHSYVLKYQLAGQTYSIEYTDGNDGTFQFTFTDGSGNRRQATYRRGHGGSAGGGGSGRIGPPPGDGGPPPR